jgi:hypothetical protein
MTYTCTALGTSPSDSGLARVQGNGTKGGNGRREGVIVLVLNGVDGLAWGELERAVSLSYSHEVHLEYGTEYLWL